MTASLLLANLNNVVVFIFRLISKSLGAVLIAETIGIMVTFTFHSIFGCFFSFLVISSM